MSKTVKVPIELGGKKGHILAEVNCEYLDTKVDKAGKLLAHKKGWVCEVKSMKMVIGGKSNPVYEKQHRGALKTVVKNHVLKEARSPKRPVSKKKSSAKKKTAKKTKKARR